MDVRNYFRSLSFFSFLYLITVLEIFVSIHTWCLKNHLKIIVPKLFCISLIVTPSHIFVSIYTCCLKIHLNFIAPKLF